MLILLFVQQVFVQHGFTGKARWLLIYSSSSISNSQIRIMFLQWQVSLLLNMQQVFEQFYTLLRHSESSKNLNRNCAIFLTTGRGFHRPNISHWGFNSSIPGTAMPNYYLAKLYLDISVHNSYGGNYIFTIKKDLSLTIQNPPAFRDISPLYKYPPALLSHM